MKHQAETTRWNPSTRARILSSVLVFVLALHWCCSAAPAQTGSGVSRGNWPSVPGAPASDSIPQGIARPSQRATMSAPLPGVLVEVFVKGGDRVKKGQILAVMDNRVAKAAVNTSRAAVDRKAEIEHARFALKLARSLLARHTALHDAQAGAEFELEQAQAQRDQAQATLDSALEAQLQAKRNLELEESRLEAHNIRAPFDGQIVRVEATVGSTLTPDDKLLTIVCLDTLEAKLYLPLEQFGKLRAGESYRLWAFAPVNRTIQARLSFASPMIDPASKTFRCVFTIDNKERHLPAGFGVRLDLPRSEPRPEDMP
ncbi:MAG: efflux RND transporter periplasmic adaptor subunit [Planctomycetota bacterium]|nr:efflux RND transporter periplasmic adaptor subunit [Planctomycetota bacterium]